MANTIISAELRIGGQDAGASAMLKEVAANIKRMEEAASHSEQVTKLGKQMAELKVQMEAVGQVKTAQRNLAVMQERAAGMATAAAHLKVEMAGVAAPTAAMTKAMEKAEVASFKANAAALKQVESIEKQRRALAEMGVVVNNAVHEEERLARAFADTAHAATITMKAEQQAAAAAKLAHPSVVASHGRSVGHGGGFDFGGAVAGFVAAHSFIGGMERVLETYREFDKEVRYQRLVMGITPEQQKPLVDQAIHGGATTRYNDIQWLETQREIAARGYGKDQVLAFSPIAARIGQALDVSMPEAVKALEGSLLGFHKDTSTMEKAMAAAERTADIQVKASKIGGLQFNDITQLLKYGAAPARMAHLSEETLYSFGVLGRKSNMFGDESGVAFRAMVSGLMKPTAGARTAMLAAGVDYSKYQTAPKAIDLNAFGRDVATKYGVRLDHGTRAGLENIFENKSLSADPARFAVAVTNLLRDKLGGDDAKSLKSIAKDAGNFRDASAGQVDVTGLMNAVSAVIQKNPALSNSIFGAKQGGRIYAILGDPELFKHTLEEVQNESQGYGKKVAEGRMEGFNGAVSKLDGSIKNLESAIGRAIDNNGQAGFLTVTHATEELAHLTQSLAEADPKVLKFGTVLAGAGAMFGAVKLAGWFTGANALKGSAVALDSSALALKEAAGAIGAGHGMPGSGPGGNAQPGSPGYSLGATPLLAAMSLGSLALGAPVLDEAGDKTRDANAAALDRFGNALGFGTLDGLRERMFGKDGNLGTWIGGIWTDMHTKPAPLPPDRYAYTAPNTDGNALHRWDEVGPKRDVALPAVVPDPVGTLTAPYLDREAERGRALMQLAPPLEKAKDGLDGFNFIMGQVDKTSGTLQASLVSLDTGTGSASQQIELLGLAARTVAGAMAGMLANGGPGGGSGIVNASYEGGDGFGGGGGFDRGRVAPSIRRGRPHATGGGGWAPSADDPVFTGAKDASGFDWSHMGVQMGAKAAYMGKHLQGIGMSEFGAAAMLGHASVESNFKVDAHNGRFEDSHGLFQWNDGVGRWSGLKRWAAANGRNPNDPLAQLDYAKVESMRMRGPGGGSVWDAMRHAGSLAEANRIWMDHFEAPKHRDYGNRLNAGQKALDAMRVLGGKVPQEHPAFALPALKPRPSAPQEGAHFTTARLEEKLERVASAVERGGLHRIHVALEKGLTGKKVYQRGNVGTTVA